MIARRNPRELKFAARWTTRVLLELRRYVVNVVTYQPRPLSVPPLVLTEASPIITNMDKGPTPVQEDGPILVRAKDHE